MIGDLRTRLGLYTAHETADVLGGVSTSWTLYAQIWAKIEPRAVSSALENGKLSTVQTYRVTIRHRDDFPERARLLWGERTLRIITASDPDMRRERLHLICEEEQQ